MLEVCIKNKLKGVPFRQEGTLFLTYIRTSQQGDASEKIKASRKRLEGKPFQIYKNPPKYCGANSIVFLKEKSGKFIHADIRRIKCNSWTCINCCLPKSLKVKYLLRDIIIENKLNKFLTFTLDPKKIPSRYLSSKHNDTHEFITKIFNSFLTSLRRDKIYKKEKLKYTWVIEFQKNGNAHLHALFNRLPYIGTVRKIWVRVGGGVQMKVVKVESEIGISNYISDYIVKGIKGNISGINTFKFLERRYSMSRSCIRPTRKLSEFLPGSSLQQKINALQSANLGDVVFSLTMGEEKSFEL